jgi:hypothetical protein
LRTWLGAGFWKLDDDQIEPSKVCHMLSHRTTKHLEEMANSLVFEGKVE